MERCGASTIVDIRRLKVKFLSRVPPNYAILNVNLAVSVSTDHIDTNQERLDIVISFLRSLLTLNAYVYVFGRREDAQNRCIIWTFAVCKWQETASSFFYTTPEEKRFAYLSLLLHRAYRRVI